MHRHINKQDRACIAALLRKNYSHNEIAEVLEVHRTTIGREIRRNGDPDGHYDARRAHKRAQVRRQYAKVSYRSIDTDTALKNVILSHLKQEWSPDQIVYRLGVSSISSIYRYTDRHPKLKKYLRRHGKRRRKYGTARIPSRYQANKRSIHERPATDSVGHWEGDTVLGKERTLRIVTYVDRVSGYLVAAKVPSGADVIHKHAKQEFSKLPCNTITYDNGTEFALHQMIERDTDARVYFADLGAPHQRGANENCNGLLRQYFPKGTAFATITNTDVQRAVRRLNDRPRKRLNYLTPREYLEKEGVRFK